MCFLFSPFSCILQYSRHPGEFLSGFLQSFAKLIISYARKGAATATISLSIEYKSESVYVCLVSPLPRDRSIRPPQSEFSQKYFIFSQGWNRTTFLHQTDHFKVNPARGSRPIKYLYLEPSPSLEWKIDLINICIFDLPNLRLTVIALSITGGWRYGTLSMKWTQTQINCFEIHVLTVTRLQLTSLLSVPLVGQASCSRLFILEKRYHYPLWASSVLDYVYFITNRFTRRCLEI